jgi:signal transduction histidine kinase
MSRWLCWGAGAIGPAGAIIALGLTSAAPTDAESLGDAIATAVGTTVGAVLGIVILLRNEGPERRIGAVLVIATATGGLTTVASAWALRSAQDPGHPLQATEFALAVDRGSWLVAFATLAVLFTIFPTGRPASRRWRPFALVEMTTFLLTWCAVTFIDKPLNAPLDVFRPSFAAPWWAGPSANAVTGALVISSFVCLLAAISSVFIRLRTADDTTRRQLIWVAFAGALLPLALAACFVELPLTGRTVVTGILLDVAIVAIPAAMGAAVLRLGLYRIDRVVASTLAFVIATGVASAVYALVAVAAGWLVGVGRGGGESTLGVAFASAFASVLAVLALIPVHRGIQSALERRFDRDRYAGTDRVDEFIARMRSARAEPEGIEETLRVALADPSLRVLMSAGDVWRTLDGGQWHDTVDVVVSPCGDGTAVAHRASLARRPRILTAVLEHASPALRMTRLRAELAVTLAEVRASRERIVEAGYEERRRLERDLHDGAQQRLVSLGITLRLMQQSLPDTARLLEPQLDRAVGEIEAVIAELRRLAAGVRPARLDDGLMPALSELARGAVIPVELAGDDVDVGGAVAVAAYYVACEAVTNAIRHSGATAIEIVVHRSDGSLTVSVSDDGVGGARPRGSSGLRGLADRVAAHGGVFLVDSPVGRGTRVEAVLPCAS